MNYFKIIEEIFGSYLADNELELFDVKMEKEDGMNWLRVYLSGKDTSLDNMTKASKYLNGKLDENDPIDGEYILDVGSKGTDQIITNYDDAVGHNVVVTMNDESELNGELKKENGEFSVLQNFKGRMKLSKIDKNDVREMKIFAKFKKEKK